MKWKHFIQLLIGIGVSVAALYYVFKDVKFSEMVAAFKAFNYWYLIPALLLFYLGAFLRAIRWGWLFKPKYDIPLSHTTGGIFICFALNSILPARAGEFARAYLIGKQDKTGFSTAFGTVVAERMLDSLTLLPCLAIALQLVEIPDIERSFNVFGQVHTFTKAKFMEWERGAIMVAMILLAGMVAVIVPLTREWILTVFRKMPLLPHTFRLKVEHMVHQFAEGANFFRNPGRLVALFVLSFVLWCTGAASVVYVARGFNMPMSFIQAFAMTVIVCIFIIPPAAPGYWGLFEVGVIFSVTIMGIPLIVNGSPTPLPDVTARSFAIMLHLTQWVPIVAIGLPWAWISHVSLDQVENLETVVEEGGK